MTRRHFNDLAHALRNNVPETTSETYRAEALLFRHLVESIAQVCAEYNPRFDWGRFTAASGLTDVTNVNGQRQEL